MKRPQKGIMRYADEPTWKADVTSATRGEFTRRTERSATAWKMPEQVPYFLLPLACSAILVGLAISPVNRVDQRVKVRRVVDGVQRS